MSLSDLLMNVNRTCKYLKSVIYYTGTLWTDIDITRVNNDCVSFTQDQFVGVLQHSRSFRSFIIPYVNICMSAWAIDDVFYRTLSLSTNLIWLNLMGCHLSTLSFIKYLTKLELLDLSNCHNLVDCDFGVIAACPKLEILNVSFTHIDSDTFTTILAPALPNLTCLEAKGVWFSCGEIQQILEHAYLSSFSLSLSPRASYTEFKDIEKTFADCIFSVGNRWIYLGM